MHDLLLDQTLKLLLISEQTERWSDNSTRYYNWVTKTEPKTPTHHQMCVISIEFQEYIDFLCPTGLITSSETQHHRQSDCLMCWPVAAGGYV